MTTNNKKKFSHPVAGADDRSPFGGLTADEFYAQHSVSHSTSSFINSRGLRIFTQSWAPLPPADLAGIVVVIHGFTGESSWFVQLTSVFFATNGFAVAALDHQGHGFSEGLAGHIPDIDPVLDDCVVYFTAFRSSHAPSLPCFLYSESLGGAIALLLHLKYKNGSHWAGLVLNGAMCGVSPKFKPPWPLEHVLWVLAALVPTWRVAVTRGNIPELSFKVEWKRRLSLNCPRRTVALPRVATAFELLRVCSELQSRFEEVNVPVLIVHGSEDLVCDPACAEELYRRASSSDKTLKMYPGLWHQMVGEADEDVELVFGDIIEWLLARAKN